MELHTQYFNPDTDIILDDYPFKALQHQNYRMLNGIWDLKISKSEDDRDFDEKVLVPAPIESSLSRMKRRIEKTDYIIYHTSFDVGDDFIKDITKLIFLGVDQEYEVILNGKHYENQVTLSLPTYVDVSDSIKEHNDLTVIVRDPLDKTRPYGKQCSKPHTMWYTPVSGIYYPVMIESYPKGYIENIRYTSKENHLTIDIQSASSSFDLEIKEKDKTILRKNISAHEEIEIPDPHYWSTEDPFLYDVTINSGSETVKSYFALRDITLREGFIYLNGRKVMLKGVLDQGYNPDGILTPPSYQLYEDDILAMKRMGFNTLRKHIKVELDMFYYLCDKLGMLVMQDFVNVGSYSYFLDSVLPTIGFQHRIDSLMNLSSKTRTNFRLHYEGLIRYLYNHPSVILYTIFNEGWGQHCADMHYDRCKALDRTRLFNTASGWYKPRHSDFNSEHEYFFNIKKLAKFRKTILLSEFGGFVYKEKGHLYLDEEKGYGYKYYEDHKEFLTSLNTFFREKVVPYSDKLVGFIYTQLSDVETEYNGLLTYDRKIDKTDEEFISIIKEMHN